YAPSLIVQYFERPLHDIHYRIHRAGRNHTKHKMRKESPLSFVSFVLLVVSSSFRIPYFLPRNSLIFFVKSSTLVLFTTSAGMMICLFDGMKDRSPFNACVMSLIAW